MTSGLTKDPVCGMEVDEKDAEFMTHIEHDTFYFCSKVRKDEFDRKEGILRDEPGKKWRRKIVKEPKGTPPKRR